MFRKRSETARKNAELMGLMVNDPALKPEQLFQIRQKTTGHRRNERHDEEVPYRTDRAEYSQRGTEVSEGRSFYRRKKPDEFNREVGRFLRERESGRD